MRSRNSDQWNEAGDYEINHLINDTIEHSRYSKYEIDIVPGLLLNETWKDKHAEWIYLQLNNDSRDSSDAHKDWMIGGVMPYPGSSEADIMREEARWNSNMLEAYNKAKAAGKVPAGIIETIKNIMEPKVDLATAIRRFINSTVRNDYSWRMPNRKYTSYGLYMPYLESPTIDKAVIGCDTSGSMSMHDIEKCVSEALGMAAVYDMELVFAWFDTMVHSVQTIMPGDDYKILRPQGRGGTNFTAAFRWAEEEMINPSFMICMTDGYDNTYDDEPPYPVLWVLTEDNSGFKPPFGEIIAIN
jgi:predicted metal-dependent peptidase